MIPALGGFLIGSTYPQEKLDRQFTDFSARNSLHFPLWFVSKKHLESQLSSHVYSGNFEQAKFLIDSGKVDINQEKWGWSQRVSTLLEEFYPHTEEDLDQFMDFISFVLDRGYQHLNHRIDKEMNLITNIYNRHMFENNTFLRRKFISFLLEKGVDPFVNSSFISTIIPFVKNNVIF